MAASKTRETPASPEAYVDAIENEGRREDCRVLLGLMSEVTGHPPKMCAQSLVGFGRYTYVYDSGRSGVAPEAGFSNRSAAITIYVMAGFTGYGPLMAKLGKYKTGVACLYVKRLSDIDLDVLRELLTASVAWIRQKYPTP